jgi:uncharacterized protein
VAQAGPRAQLAPLQNDADPGKERSMNNPAVLTRRTHAFGLCGAALVALPSGALWMPAEATICVSDLHLGKSERVARRSGIMLPPYETRATLERLEADIATTGAQTIICLGDSFDDLEAAQSLNEEARLLLARMQAARCWIWIAGNHDPGPVDLGGSHLAEYHGALLAFRHIAVPGARAEVSGHYHPKFALPGGGAARACFLFDSDRVILPAYGAYTGGLSAMAAPLRSLMAARAFAVLTGHSAILAPLPQAGAPARRSARQARPPRGCGG